MQSISLLIFQEQTTSKPKTVQIPEPNWPYLFFLRYKPEFQEKIQAFSEKNASSFSLFLQGITREYGILARKNLAQALSNYKEGAELNDAYCHFKLFYIYSEDYQKYHMQKNRDLAISHLLQAAAFWDPNCNNTDILMHVNPKKRLGALLENEDEKLMKIRVLIHKYFKGNAMKHNFLTNWVMVEFPFETDLAEFHYDELILFVENSEYPEGCFYYGNRLIESFKKEKCQDVFKRAEELLMIAVKANVIKAHFALSLLYEEAEMSHEALDILKKGSKLGCSLCLDSLSSYYSIGLNTARDFTKASKYAFDSFLFGNMVSGHTFKDIGCYMKSVGLDSRVEDLDRKIFLIAENLSEIHAEYNQTLQKVGADVYLLAKCYIYGINCSVNLKKALEIVNETIETQSVEDKKYLLYTKARILMKLGADFEETMKESFKNYESFMKSEKNKKFPQHYYRMGKFCEHGWGVCKDLVLAIEFYEKGAKSAEEKPNMFWMQFLYLQKCRTKTKELASILERSE